jgi:D-3-phosphoglycerate dehydrogenase
MLAPHHANSSPLAWERVHINTIRNLLEGLELPVPEISTR